MKLFKIINALNISLLVTMLLFPQLALSQQNKMLKSDRTFISMAYYDIFGKNISSAYLDHLVNFTVSSGDKALSKDLIIRMWLFSEDKEKSESKLDDHYLEQFITVELDGDVVSRITKLVAFVGINELLSLEGALFDNIDLMDRRMDSIMPDIEIPEHLRDPHMLMEVIKQDLNILKRINNYFLDVYKSDSNSQSLNHQQFFTKSKRTIEAKSPILYKVLLEFQEDSQELTQSQKIPQREDILPHLESFITDTYSKLFLRTPSTSELNLWKQLFIEKSAINPKLMYYILMKEDEYAFL